MCPTIKELDLVGNEIGFGVGTGSVGGSGGGVSRRDDVNSRWDACSGIESSGFSSEVA